MALSQAYLEWERQTEQRGLERGMERGESLSHQRSITTILATRFGTIDRQLEAIISAMLDLPIEESTRLLLQLSREELLQRFSS